MKGYPQQEKEDRLSSEFVTVSPSGVNKFPLDVKDHSVVHNFNSDAAEAGSTTTVINATAHVARKGDKLRFTSGAHNTLEVDVWSVATNTITLAQTLSSAPAPGDTFDVLRPTSFTVAADGGISVSVPSVGPVQFVRNGTDTEVEKDTVTPANNRPLPVELIDTSGNLNTVTVSSSALPTGAATEATLSTIDADTSALAGTVAGSELQVDIVTSALPSGAATEATLLTVAGDTTSLDGKVPSQGAAVIAASLPVNIASDQTVPISAASLPLPTGAATEATLSTIDSDTSTIAGAVSGTEMQVDVVASLPAGTNNIGDVDIASALPAGTNTIGAVNLNRLDIVDLFDSPILDTSSSNIPGSASGFLEVVASLASTVQAIQILDTTGAFIGLYTGPAASEVLKLVIGPGSDQTIQAAISSGTRVSLRRLDSTTAISSGIVAMNFMG